MTIGPVLPVADLSSPYTTRVLSIHVRGLATAEGCRESFKVTQCTNGPGKRKKWNYVKYYRQSVLGVHTRYFPKGLKSCWIHDLAYNYFFSFLPRLMNQKIEVAIFSQQKASPR